MSTPSDLPNENLDVRGLASCYLNSALASYISTANVHYFKDTKSINCYNKIMLYSITYSISILTAPLLNCVLMNCKFSSFDRYLFNLSILNIMFT